MKRAVVSGPFDNMRFGDFRFLDEASKLGEELRVLLWSDELVATTTGRPPRFPLPEREYVVRAIRHVHEVTIVRPPIEPDALPMTLVDRAPDVWAVTERDDTAAKRAWCRSRNMELRVFTDEWLRSVPKPSKPPENPAATSPTGRKVVVTGCFDWFHSGHVRFFEEVSELGDLYVIVGHDDNLRLLKGEGHPLFPAAQRRYVAGSIRYVKQAVISSGHGWMDAEPEFLRIKPDIYAVNEDGDKPEKREFCQEHGIEYRVLKREPKQGLARRSSTVMRGF
jgi:cytidyltransferase-like protein